MPNIIDVIDEHRKMPFALGNAMKNPALTSAKINGKTFTRGQHRDYWAELRKRRQGPLIINMSF
jgi:hypothetical protein